MIITADVVRTRPRISLRSANCPSPKCRKSLFKQHWPRVKRANRARMRKNVSPNFMAETFSQTQTLENKRKANALQRVGQVESPGGLLPSLRSPSRKTTSSSFALHHGEVCGPRVAQFLQVLRKRPQLGRLIIRVSEIQRIVAPYTQVQQFAVSAYVQTSFSGSQQRPWISQP